MGGFHLSGPAFEPIIKPSIDALAEIGPKAIIPARYSGWRAAQAIAERMPDAYIPNSVGSRLELRTEAEPDSRQPPNTKRDGLPRNNFLRKLFRIVS